MGRFTAAATASTAARSATGRYRSSPRAGAYQAATRAADKMPIAPMSNKTPTSPSVVLVPPLSQIRANLTSQATPPTTASTPAVREAMTRRYARRLRAR